MQNNKNIQKHQIKVSIIIINYNTREYLKQYLDSLRNVKSNNILIDILVVDNGSSDNSVRMVKDNYPEVGLICNDKNAGYSKAANQGIKSSDGEYIIVSNTDIIIIDNALEKMTMYIKDHNDVGIVAPKVYDDVQRKSVQCSCRTFPSIQTALFNRYSLLTRLFPNNRWSNRYLMRDWDHKESREVDWVSGCFFITRRDAISNAGFFDEDFFMYNEDVDLCFRIKRAGWKVLYFPYAEIVHKIGVSRLNSRSIRERHKGMWFFYCKHYAKNRLLNVPIQFAILMRMAYSLLVQK